MYVDQLRIELIVSPINYEDVKQMESSKQYLLDYL